jgi:hypothetical protein
MKRAVVFMALGGFALASLGLGLQNFSTAQSAELDGFAINTHEKAVTVTLFTDQRVPFTTEQQGKQYAIILPNTQLSEQQINNGLPVVIDNKNRFIGRAVPTEDGKVKIILPNLPANEYAVSIQQKRAGQSVAAEPTPAIKPRPAVNHVSSNHFEQVASQFTKPAKLAVSAGTNSLSHETPSIEPSLKLTPTPSGIMNFQTSSGGSIWNPYVVKTPAVPAPGSTPYSKYRPVTASRRPAHQPTAPEPQINTVALNEFQKKAEPGYNALSTLDKAIQTTNANNAPDPLWYLHSLPPSNTTTSPADNLNGPALDTTPLTLSPAPAVPEKTVEKEPHHGVGVGIKEAFASIPKWLLITLGLFLGGIGIFALIGGLVLLRILFSQTRQQFSAQAIPVYHPSGLSLYAPIPQPDQVPATGPGIQPIEKQGYASRPNVLSTLAFQDKACFSALDYLKESPNTIRQAVHNTVLVKFPSRKRHRSGTKKRVNRQVGSAAIYSYNP